MKKIFLFGAMVCALGMMVACKSGQQNGNTPKEFGAVNLGGLYRNPQTFKPSNP